MFGLFLIPPVNISRSSLMSHLSCCFRFGHRPSPIPFHGQARAEEAAGLPVAPFMQGLDSLATRAKLQHGFISFVLERWWRNVVRLFPALQPCWDHLMENKAHFARLMAEATTTTTTTTTTAAAVPKGDGK
jgi:hypothetical protein